MADPAWLGEFREALEAFDGPRVCALGTRLGRVRMVVLREIGDDGSLVFTSDERSRKNAAVRSHGFGEACFWVEPIRTQWRLAGAIEVETGGERWARVWEAMSPAARALFTWPASGEPVGGEYAETYGGGPTEHYALLVLRPAQVDRLDLRPHPHARRVWDGDGGTDVNP